MKRLIFIINFEIRIKYFSMNINLISENDTHLKYNILCKNSILKIFQ